MKLPLEKQHNLENNTNREYILTNKYEELDELIIQTVDNFCNYNLQNNDFYSSYLSSASKNISKKINYKNSFYKNSYDKLINIKKELGEEEYKKAVNSVYSINKKSSFQSNVSSYLLYTILNFPLISNEMYEYLAENLKLDSNKLKKLNKSGIKNLINYSLVSILLNL